MMKMIGKRLKLARNALEMTAEHVAHEVGCSDNQIWSIERGGSKPNALCIALICKEYRLSMDTLFFGSDKEFYAYLNDIYKKAAEAELAKNQITIDEVMDDAVHRAS